MTSGLIIFYVVVLSFVIGAPFDYWLKKTGRRTISQRIWQHPVWGWLLIGWAMFGVIGLAYHLWVPPVGG